MKATNMNVRLFVTFFSLGAAVSALSELSDERKEKHFSLFSVVTFKNEECTSEASLAGGARTGTCYSTTECSDKDGMKSGNCASGFGVCCLFFEASSASATVSNNRTHIRNTEFPATAAATTAQTIAYTLQKMSSDICQIRLDFVVFLIAGPANTAETIAGLTTMTHCTNDVLTFAQTGGFAVPSLCGSLTGEHIYLDLGALSTDTSVMTLTTGVAPLPAVALREWDIKTSQIPCWASYRAPEGCHRYFTSDFGKIISYNFRQEANPAIIGATNVGGNSGLELSGQNVNTCIRRSKGMCCVEYLLCTSFNSIALATPLIGTISAAGVQGTYSESWRIDLNSAPMAAAATQANSGMIDAMCSSDYVGIPSSWSGACGANGSGRGTMNSRYCGAQFGANLQCVQAISTSGPVCDCSEPFTVSHFSDAATDLGGAGAIATININVAVIGRGFCLDFVQQPCYY